MQSVRLLMAAALLMASLGAQQQRAGTAVLSVRVQPEQRLTPAIATLNFVVTADGTADVLAQTVPVNAWVRALPGQRIRIVAQVAGLPQEAELLWSASPGRATGGGQAASCTSGVLAAGATGELAANWTRSGILTCSVTFQLANPRQLAPGSYALPVTFAVRAE